MHGMLVCSYVSCCLVISMQVHIIIYCCASRAEELVHPGTASRLQAPRCYIFQIADAYIMQYVQAALEMGC